MADLQTLRHEVEALKLQLQHKRKNTKETLSIKDLSNREQHATVGIRRGKWWLQDRQMLSRAFAAEAGKVIVKLRETWIWSGRTVILDKIAWLDEMMQENPLMLTTTNEVAEEIEVSSEMLVDTSQSLVQRFEIGELNQTASETTDSAEASKTLPSSSAESHGEVRESLAPNAMVASNPSDSKFI
ncbi:uncharacterized protein PHALS_10729 [Plasmopara halstedii]|uniref:Uncharacterized protein n=1 Tax=Plasmopara halstedii TaxID=4781 RepID=A0A0P1AHS3_PLAHL|nr:uncharacterized protein PHALS_10729 [Plasmopara halstedii]CEG40535.1 hypothetical protein PHALS_10729 [Plasmopara halstedii]|eukprot:XP_024576904.1 hypothetical protein PHALS_10729 [Plasmopara halstedii]